MARPRLGDSDSKRLQMVITEDELAAIDDWRFANRVSTRSEAIRRLVQLGIQSDVCLDRLNGAEDTLRRILLRNADQLFFGSTPNEDDTSGTDQYAEARWLLAELLKPSFQLTKALRDLNDRASEIKNSADLLKILKISQAINQEVDAVRDQLDELLEQRNKLK